MYGVIDFSRSDTLPGGCGPFAPPAGWQGDYRQCLQARFDDDIGVRQQITVVSRILVCPAGRSATRFLGPHAVAAREFARSVWPSIRRN